MRPLPATEEAAVLERVLFEAKKVIIGQDRLLERLLVSLLARGHCLIEGVPGLAKTLTIETIGAAIGGTYARLQFTPDMLPSDIVGTRVYRASSEQFDVELGPVFANLVLADEINRAPAKVQSALLEVMAERHVSIAGTTYPVPQPFLVLATQNPIESEGVYTLPEAQRDRFLMKLVVGYPTHGDELEVVRRMGVRPPRATQVIDPATLVQLQAAADDVFVDGGVADYAVRLVLATRTPEDHGVAELAPYLSYGASPRGSLGLVAAARALALLRARDYVVPQDVFDVAFDVLRHRLVLSYEALAEGVDADTLLARVLSVVPAPLVESRRVAGIGVVKSDARRLGRRLGPRAAAPARPDGDPPPRRHAPGRLPGSVARPGLGAGGGPDLLAGRRRAPDGLERHRPDRRGPRASAHRRPGAGDLGGGRPLRQPRLRHGPLREARPGHRRRGGRGLPHRPGRQPDRGLGHRRRGHVPRSRPAPGGTTCSPCCTRWPTRREAMVAGPRTSARRSGRWPAWPGAGGWSWW